MRASACLHGILRAGCCAGLGMMLAGAAARAVGDDTVHDGFRALETNVHASWPENTSFMRLGGLPVYYRRFSSSTSVHDTAEALARKTGLFNLVLAFRSKLVLSGSHDGWHWVAEIDADPLGARGLVSAVPIGAHSVAGPAWPDARVFAGWLPDGAELRFDQTLRYAQGAALQRVYRVALPPPRVWQAVWSGLAEQGWSRATEQSDVAPGWSETWSRRQSSLTVALAPDASGSALFVHYRE